MPMFQAGDVTIRYEEAGEGPPVLVIPGGGLNATVEMLDGPCSFNPLKELADMRRCIAMRRLLHAARIALPKPLRHDDPHRDR